MLTETPDREEIIERVAASDIGKAELMCCVRVPDPARPGSGRSILVIIWHLLSDPHGRYADLGPDCYTRRTDPDRRRGEHVRQLQALGYTVYLERAA